MPGLLDLPMSIIEQLAKVRLDEPMNWYPKYAPQKKAVFWILREIGHPGLFVAAWTSRHSVLRPTLGNLAQLGDAEWCRLIVKQGADVEERFGNGQTRALRQRRGEEGGD